MIRTAACTCGRLRLTATEDPIRVSVCHCFACQKRTGSAFGVQARFPAAAITQEGDATEFVRVGDGGATITFRFCPTCGDTQSWRVGGLDGVAVPVGAFADASFPAPTRTVYEARAHPWLQLHGIEARMD